MIDGTQIKAEIPVEHQRLFRGRKNECTHNVMAICYFAMLFMFVYVGWEGTANDGRVFKDAVTGDNGFEWPTDGVYLVVKMSLSIHQTFSFCPFIY